MMTIARFHAVMLAGLLAGAPALAAPTGIADDFESYGLGGLPAPLWLDAGGFDPQPPVAALPSATVEATTDAFGAPTQALAISDQVALLSGIYQPVPLSTRYSLAADVRVDRFNDAPTFPTADFPIQLTFAEVKRNFYTTPQAGIYASSLTQSWRLFLLEDVGNLSADIDLAPVTPGQWVRLAFALDTATGNWRVSITDIAGGLTLVDTAGAFAGWSSGNGKYDSIAFIEGEGSPGVTIGNLAWVDNVNVTATPAPAGLALFGLGLGLVGARCRR